MEPKFQPCVRGSVSPIMFYCRGNQDWPNPLFHYKYKIHEILRPKDILKTGKTENLNPDVPQPVTNPHSKKTLITQY